MSSIGNNADFRAIKDYFDRTEPNNNEANSVRESFYRWFETKAWALRVRGIHVQDQVIAKAKRYRDRFNALNADPSLAGPIGDSPMLNATLKRLDFHFDKANESIVFSGETQEGSGFRVAFPIAHVSAVFDEEAAAMGYTEVLMGEYGATLDGFHRQVFRARQRGYGGVYERALNRVRRHARHYGLAGARYVNDWQNNEYGDDPELGSLWSSFKKFTLAPITLPVAAAKVVARSKAVGTALGGVAVVFPAVGAPALAAWGAAHATMAMYDAHQKGHRTNFPQLHANLTRLQNENSLEAHTTMAALASVPPDINDLIRQAQDFLSAARSYQARGSINVSANLGAYIAPPTGHTGSSLARVAPPAATSAATYVAPPMTVTAPRPPVASTYIAPPMTVTAPRPYVAPPTGRYIAPPTWRSYIAPPANAFIAPPTGRYIAPPTGRNWNEFRRPLAPAQFTRNWINPNSFIAPPTAWNDYRPAPPAPALWNMPSATAAPIAPPPPGYFRDINGNLRTIASEQEENQETFDPSMPYGRRHHRRHEFAHEPAQTFHQGYYQ